MTDAEKLAARGGMSAGAVKKAVRARDGFKCVKCGTTEAAHRERYNTALEVHRLTPGSLYTLPGCITTCRPCNAALPRLPWGGTDLEHNPAVRNVCIEMDDDLLAELRAFCEERGQSLRFVIERAVDRHMAAPPPLMPDPPLLPAEPDPAPAKKAPSKAKKK